MQQQAYMVRARSSAVGLLLTIDCRSRFATPPACLPPSQMNMGMYQQGRGDMQYNMQGGMRPPFQGQQFVRTATRNHAPAALPCPPLRLEVVNVSLRRRVREWDAACRWA